VKGDLFPWYASFLFFSGVCGRPPFLFDYFARQESWPRRSQSLKDLLCILSLAGRHVFPFPLPHPLLPSGFFLRTTPLFFPVTFSGVSPDFSSEGRKSIGSPSKIFNGMAFGPLFRSSETLPPVAHSLDHFSALLEDRFVLETLFHGWSISPKYGFLSPFQSFPYRRILSGNY